MTQVKPNVFFPDMKSACILGERRPHIFTACVTFILLLAGCDYAPTLKPDYDFSQLGNTQFDNIVRKNVIANFDFYTYMRDIALPNDNPLVMDIGNLLQKNDANHQATEAEIEKYGAVCGIGGQKKACVYHAQIMTRYHLVISDGSDTLTEYVITIFPDTHPASYEILRKRRSVN